MFREVLGSGGILVGSHREEPEKILVGSLREEPEKNGAGHQVPDPATHHEIPRPSGMIMSGLKKVHESSTFLNSRVPAKMRLKANTSVLGWKVLASGYETRAKTSWCDCARKTPCLRIPWGHSAHRPRPGTWDLGLRGVSGGPAASCCFRDDGVACLS